MKKSSDEEWRRLLAKLAPAEPRQSDQRAREQVLVAIYERLARIAKDVLRRAAWIDAEPEELASTVLLRVMHPVLESKHGLVDKILAAKSPESYIYAVVRNVALDEARRSMTRGNRHTGLASADADSISDKQTGSTIEAREEVAAVTEGFLHALGRLRKKDRELVVRFLGGESTTSLAQQYGVTNSAMATRISRARAKLRKMPELARGSEALSDQGVKAGVIEKIREFLSNQRRDV